MFALVLLIVVLLPGCTNSNSAEPGVVTIALDQNPDSLDPRIGQNAAAQHLAALIFNSLVRKNENSEIVPDLASRWEMPDPQTYVFHLRHDVRFHDGRPLTSRDVQYTFRSLLNGTVHTIKAGHPYNLITSVEAPDPYTAVFKLKDVYAPFLWNLAVGIRRFDTALPDHTRTSCRRFGAQERGPRHCLKRVGAGYGRSAQTRCQIECCPGPGNKLSVHRIQPDRSGFSRRSCPASLRLWN